ncbi:MAG: hypothetical protein HQ523_11880 [Lentisphaerae bacterium]|nr:hypothetical protein [Lentisphaerota bacterium]
MHENEFSGVVDSIHNKDPRYQPEAYYFIREALDFAVRMHRKSTADQMRHVSAAELLEGIRVYVLQEYGPMALTVLTTWGLHNTEDIGNVVFNLVASGKLGKTEEDRQEDFAGGYDFTEAFMGPFTPRHPGEPTSPPAGRGTLVTAQLRAVARPTPPAEEVAGE